MIARTKRRLITRLLVVAAYFAASFATSVVNAAETRAPDETRTALKEEATRASQSAEELITSERVLIRVFTDPDSEDEIVKGQQIRLLIEILTDARFQQAPRYPELTIPGAITLMPEQMGTNFTETIGSTAYTGQRRSYVLYPQRLGALEVPPIEIELAIHAEGGVSEPFAMRTPPITLYVEERPGVDETTPLVTTPQLRIRDEWSGTFEDLIAGDAIERTVVIEGEEIVGMLLPSLQFEAPSGIVVYSDPPRIRDRVNRGRYRGERSQTVTYILQERGSFEIPSIDVAWWNLTDDRLEIARLEAKPLEVSGSFFGAASGASDAPSFDGLFSRMTHSLVDLAQWVAHRWIELLLLGGLIFVVGRTLHAFGPRLQLEWKQALDRRRDSERRAFASLSRTLTNGDHSEITAAYWRWRDRLQGGFPRVAEVLAVETPRDPQLSAAWRGFEAKHYAGEDTPDAAINRSELRKELRHLRAHLLRAAQARRASRANGRKTGPRLNPLARR